MKSIDGFFLIKKGTGMTSFDVIRDLRRITGVKKIGHSGTLDPLATGLMLVAVGQGTKLLEYLIGEDKEYEVLVEFGKISDSYDADGELSEYGFEGEISRNKIDQEIETSFLGLIEQIPPKYSALKINGKRACDIVRSGGEVKMKAREVLIKYFELDELNWPFARFKVGCGSGTYIRSLINDLGENLNCGAYVKELHRTEIGEFEVADAVNIEDLKDDWKEHFYSISQLDFGFDRFDLEIKDFDVLKHGRVLDRDCSEFNFPLLAYLDGNLVGVLEICQGGVKFRKQIIKK